MKTARIVEGKIFGCIIAAAIALGAANFAKGAVVDLGGESVTWAASDMKSNKNNTVTNGTITLSAVAYNSLDDGTYTFGEGLTLNHTSGDFIIAGGKTVELIDGATLNWSSGGSIRFGSHYNGTTQFILDNGHATCGTSEICLPYMNASQGANKSPVIYFAMDNGSSLVCATNKEVKLGQFTGTSEKLTTKIQETVAITNSSITAKQVRLGVSASTYLSNTSDSYLNVTFGTGTVLNVGQVYTYAYPAPTVVFDGAKICWNALVGDSLVGQNNAVTTYIYTIGPNGLVIDKQSGYSRTEVANMASALSGTGGITKTGPGDITWNYGRIGSSNNNPMTFTGPLVVSNGTWSSSIGYAASAFRADGGTLVLSGALSASNVELAATEGGTLTLTGATITDTAPSLELAGSGTTDYFTRDSAIATYTIDTLTLGPGAVLTLDASASATDVISATTTNITATAESPATIKLILTEMPSIGTTYTFFDADSADKFSAVLMYGDVQVSCETSVVDGKLVITTTVENYTWNGTGSNWGDTGAWTVNSASATWSAGNKAIFLTDGATAAVDTDYSAYSISFTENATLTGTGTLAVPTITVADGKSASIAGPVSGTLEKQGAGTLTLASSRTEQTTVTEGTLAMTDEATLDPSLLTLGTDATKSVVLDYGGQTISANPQAYIAAGMDVTLTNGTFTTTVNPGYWQSTAPKTLTIAKDAVFSTTSRYTWNSSSTQDEDVTNVINIVGGTMKSEQNGNNWIMQNSRSGTLKFNVSEGGLLEFGGKTYMLPCRDSTTTNDTPRLLMSFNDSTFRVDNDANLLLGHDDGSNKRGNPQGAYPRARDDEFRPRHRHGRNLPRLQHASVQHGRLCEGLVRQLRHHFGTVLGLLRPSAQRRILQQHSHCGDH